MPKGSKGKKHDKKHQKEAKGDQPSVQPARRGNRENAPGKPKPPSLTELGLCLKRIPADGNCLFGAFADQITGDCHLHEEFRKNAVAYIRANSDAFVHFIDDGMSFDSYCSRMEKLSVWGGNVELKALACFYERNVILYQPGDAPLEMAFFNNDTPCVMLSYHNRHYNSVRLRSNNKGPTLKLTLAHFRNAGTDLDADNKPKSPHPPLPDLTESNVSHNEGSDTINGQVPERCCDDIETDGNIGSFNGTTESYEPTSQVVDSVACTGGTGDNEHERSGGVENGQRTEPSSDMKELESGLGDKECIKKHGRGGAPHKMRKAEKKQAKKRHKINAKVVPTEETSEVDELAILLSKLSTTMTRV